MKTSLMTTFLCAALMAGTATLVEAADVESCLAKLEAAHRGLPGGDLDSCANTIRCGVRRGDVAAGERLLAIAANDDVHVAVRAKGLELACEKANRTLAEEIVALVGKWASELDVRQLRPTEKTASDKCIAAKSSLLFAFATKCPQSLEGVLGAPEPLLDVLTVIATRSWCSLEAKAASLKAIAENPAPIEVRRQYALRIVDEKRASTQLPHIVLGLLNRDVSPRLREFLRTSEDPETFHFAAAAALAHLGDQETAKELEKLLPRFRERGANAAGILTSYLWQIEIQHPPQRLLQYIGSGTDLAAPQRRLWAIRRAVEVNPDKEAIRRAVLAHAEKIQADKRPSLTSIKSLAQSLGVLREKDLPDVKTVPLHPPTP